MRRARSSRGSFAISAFESMAEPAGPSRDRRRRSVLARALRAGFAVSVLLALAACTSGTVGGTAKKPLGPIGRIAILRLDRGEATPDATLGRGEESPTPLLAPDAEAVVTAQIYGVMANDARWRLVPDLDVAEAMRRISTAGTLASRAQALGKETRADAVLTGRVSRFQERVGTQFGSRHPASVAFQLELVQSADGEVLWSGAFDQTQQPLSSNLFDFWMFWREGPRWFTAAELARLGVERLVEDMARAVEQP
jgi:hypothetical protein